MPDTEITYSRAFKIWWSYVWRAFVLLIPVTILLLPVLFWVLPFPTPGERAPEMGPDQIPVMMGKMSVVWLVMMMLNILLQVQAMRWMLKTQWRDFRLKAVVGE